MIFDSLISITTLRSLSTVLAFAAFIAICVWAYSQKRRDAFDEAANLPFADEHLSENAARAIAVRDSSSRESSPSRPEKIA